MPKCLLQIGPVKLQTPRTAQPAQYPRIVLMRPNLASKRVVATHGSEE